MNVSVRLASGEVVTLADGPVATELYDELWRIGRRGAITTVLKLHDARRQRSRIRLVVLDEHETDALREALLSVPAAVPPR